MKTMVRAPIVLLVVLLLAAFAKGAWANDGPAGFWYGSDSQYMPVGGSGPYEEPSISGSYGGYIGMIGSWEWWQGCKGAFLFWSPTNAAQAHTNYARYGLGVGTGAYWFMGGPGVDPSYNGTTSEAYAWGAAQAKRMASDLAGQTIDYRVAWMDIELPGISPAPDNGWDSVYTSPCSGKVKQSFVPASLDRADFNGFWDTIGGYAYTQGVYSAPNVWTRIFGTGGYSQIPGTEEWTYEPETSNLSQHPYKWHLANGETAQFFGGDTYSSQRALMWQWSGGGGVRNGVGDFDQIDAQFFK